MTAIHNLLIDFGGVLIDLDRQRCIREFQKLGFQEIESCLGLYQQQRFFQLHEKGLISSEEFRSEIRKHIPAPVTDAQIDHAWNSFLTGIPTYKLEQLLRLRRQYRICLLSNTNEIHWEWSCRHAFPYKGFSVNDYFERIYLSYEMKMAKPDPEIFKAVLKDSSFIPQETLFIDDAAANCRTAEALGISTYTPAAGEDWGTAIETLLQRGGKGETCKS